ncbi:hypothetical protein FF2_001738 [Malus domestica]
MPTCAARWTTVTGKVLRVSRSRLCWGPAQRSHCSGAGGRVGKGFFGLDDDVFPGREAGEDAAVGVGRWVLRKKKRMVMEHRRRNLGLCGKFSSESFGLFGF